MRVFILSAAAAVVLAVAAHFGLDTIQRSAAQANSTGGARLDQQESVNFYGREG